MQLSMVGLMVQDLVASLESYHGLGIDIPQGEERSKVHRMPNLEVGPGPEGYEVSGVFCNRTPTGRHR